MDALPQLLTVGKIASDTGEQVTRIQYVLSTRPHIKAVARAGNTRLYDSAAVTLIREALADMNSRQSRREPAPC